MTKLYIIVLSFFLAFNTSAQLPLLRWAKAFYATGNYRDYSNGRTIGIDKQGNVYTAGLFFHTVDFDPSSSDFLLTGGSSGDEGIYISKLNADGNFVWAEQIPTTVEWSDIELKVDKDGNIYLASYFGSTIDMDPGQSVYMMTAIGVKDAFVIKLNTNGNLMWAKQFGGPGDTGAEVKCLDIDKDNNVIVCGIFNNTIDFDPGPNTFNITSTAWQQAYIVKLTNDGDFVWAKQFGNSSVVYNNSNIYDVKCDRDGNIITCGTFAGTCDFDPGISVYNLTSSSFMDGFISKLDPNGNFVWADKIGNTTNDYYRGMRPRGLDVDASNNVINSGYFAGTKDFDPGAGVYSVSSNSLSNDCYILKLNEQGKFIWVKTIGGNEDDSGDDLKVDNENNIYVIGGFGTSVDFDPGPGTFIINSPNYGASVIVKLDSSGSFIYAAPFQSINYGSTLFRRMTLDTQKNIYVTGYVAGSVDFDPGPNVYPLNGFSDESPFVLKLGKCENYTTSTLYENACNNYTLNNKVYDSSGIYTQTIPNSSGCDSLITLHLTLNKKSTQQTKTICEGDSFFVGGIEQNKSGIYIDTLQAITGCDSVITTNLIVNSKPSLNLGSDTDICNNKPLIITPGIFKSYLWQDNSNLSSYTINTSGTYWVNVTNDFNCTASDTLQVYNVFSAPSNFLSKSDSICSYDNLEITPKNEYANYLWSTGSTEKSINVKDAGKFELTVTDVHGCVGTDSIEIFLKECMFGIYIPSAFTPNDDSKNDIFKPLVFGRVKQYHFIIFNRYGAIVFETTELHKGWNGEIAGIKQSNGVYVWVCTYQFEGEESKIQKGTVTLIR